MALRIRQHREQKGLTQRALAEAVGLSRQSLNSIEAGHSVPSVAISLKLARVLGSSVEALFGELANEEVAAELVGTCEAGARVLLGFVRERWIAHRLSRAGMGETQIASDGYVRALRSRHGAAVELNRAASDLRQSVLLGGCAPGLSVLADRLNGSAGPGRFRWLTQSNGAALRALSAGHVHVAGVHFPKLDAGQVVRAVARHLPTARADVYALASWDAGLVVPKGNPRRMRDVRDLVLSPVRVALREAGSGARQQLERMLRKLGEPLSTLLERAVDVRTHMEVAYAVSLGAADVGFAIRGVAQALELDFVPLVEERFDLIVPEDLGDDPRVVRLLETLASGLFRRELGGLGYDVALCGQRIARAQAP